MGKLIEMIHVSLGGEVGRNDWALPYLNEQHLEHATTLVQEADALLLGRKTYDGLSAAYPTMPSSPFVDRMNAIPKHVATRNPFELEWNAVALRSEVSGFVTEFKERARGNLLKFGNGPVDVPLMEKGLIDEFHLLLTPVASGSGRHLFEDVVGDPPLNLLRVQPFDNGVVLLVYGP